VLLVTDEAAGAFAPGDHGSTFGGNPVSCAAARAVVEAIDDDLLGNVRARSAQLVDGLERLAGVVSVRGRGLLLGAVVEGTATDVVDAARAEGLLVLSAGEDVVRLAPPLTVSESEVDDAITVLSRISC
jgi:acetylornithine aminotransferase